MQLLVDVEEIAFGHVFRMLDTTKGVARLTIVSDTVKRPGKTSGQKKGGAQSAACLVLGALNAAKNSMSRPQLVLVLEASGKKGSTLPSTLNELWREKEILRSGDGQNVRYRITMKGRKRFQTACQIQEA
jgi:hypothetical protein